MTPITAKERKRIENRSKQREERLRRKYPEVHGKVVDFVTQTIDDGTLYFTVMGVWKAQISVRVWQDLHPETEAFAARERSSLGNLGRSTVFQAIAYQRPEASLFIVSPSAFFKARRIDSRLVRYKCDRSISATEPRICEHHFPIGVEVSICSDRLTTSIPRALKVSRARSK
jgi:hypothetical protein